MAERRPSAPAGLAKRGRRFWTRTVTAFSLTDAELELLVECCRCLDECEALQTALTLEGVSTTGSKGQPRVHPAVGELRQVRLTLGRLLAQLALTAEEDEPVPSPATLRARHAANSRWGVSADVRSSRGPA